MKFHDAAKLAIEDGKKIRKVTWFTGESIHWKNDYFVITVNGGAYMPTNKDFGEAWELYEPTVLFSSLKPGDCFQDPKDKGVVWHKIRDSYEADNSVYQNTHGEWFGYCMDRDEMVINL